MARVVEYYVEGEGREWIRIEGREWIRGEGREWGWSERGEGVTEWVGVGVGEGDGEGEGDVWSSPLYTILYRGER